MEGSGTSPTLSRRLSDARSATRSCGGGRCPFGRSERQTQSTTTRAPADRVEQAIDPPGGSMRCRSSVSALPVLALLAVAAPAGATTTVGVQQVEGLDVVVAVDDDTAADLETVQGVDEGTQQPFVAVQNAGGATPGTGCQVVSPAIVGCVGEF